MTSAMERKAQLMAECKLQLAWEWEEQEACQQREKEEFAHEIVDLELKKEEKQKAWEEEEWRAQEVEERRA